MNDQNLCGRAHKLGDDINTDYIIAGKYTKTLDYDSLAEHLFEDIDPDFTKNFRLGDFIVAGMNFGCGSSREQAPLAIKYAGAGAVLAKSFSRIFFRNAINLGIPAVICDTERIDQGDELELRLRENRIINRAKQEAIDIEPLSPVMISILGEGGLVEYLKNHGTFDV